MGLVPGSRYGVFEIVAPLGAGGMGEVYRPLDTKEAGEFPWERAYMGLQAAQCGTKTLRAYAEFALKTRGLSQGIGLALNHVILCHV
jgi:hypothetical protein